MQTTANAPAASFNALESSLLEGLFQLVRRGDTDSSEFQQINDEIYNRLCKAYGT